MADTNEEKNQDEKTSRRKNSRKKDENKKKKGSSDSEDEEEEGEKGGGPLIALIAILIVAIWLAIFALLIKMDVGGFGSTVMYPILKDVPVLNKILPDVEEDYSSSDGDYNFQTMDEAIARIKELEQQLADAQSSDNSDSARIAELEQEAAELQTYKDNEAAFEAEKEKFYQEVVFSDKAPDIDEYKQYYESIDPDNAAELYKQVVQQEQTDDQISQYASAYSSMKPAQAAAIFDTMTDNLALVGKILWAMDAESRGNILGNMDPSTAAAVTKLMEP